VVLGIVGYEDPNPQYVRLENGQPWVEVRMEPEGDEIVARLAIPGAGTGAGQYFPLEFGCRVILDLPDGDPQRAVIVGRLWDETCHMPGEVAGVTTNADSARGETTAIAPAWSFQRLPNGQLLAIETGTGGDVLIHAGASMHLKCGSSGAVHIDGAVHLGVSPTTAPVGAQVGPAGETIPGVPAVPNVPVPFVATSAPPYVGFEDGIIRAKDGVAANITTDPAFFVWVTAVSAGLVTPIPPGPLIPTSLACAFNGTGSKHTASD
jgi:hypothetical protein